VSQSSTRSYYGDRPHSILHGPLTVLLIVWAVALPGIIALFTAFGPIGWLLGVGLAVLLGVPWIIGLLILWFVRRLT
jgi:Mg2+/Co2+ transporter CorB